MWCARRGEPCAPDDDDDDGAVNDESAADDESDVTPPPPVDVTDVLLVEDLILQQTRIDR